MGQESELRSVKIDCNSLRNAMFTIETIKELVIYVPPNYTTSNKAYPVIYYLPGFNSPLKEFVDGSYEGFKLKDDLDELIVNNSIKEMIVVMCDGNNFFGGNFYTNSILLGNNEGYIVKDVVSYVDSNFRTIPKSSSRGISGNSMGGYGALTIAMKFPDIFGHCYVMSPGAFDQQGMYEMNIFNSSTSLTRLNELVTDVNTKPLNRRMDYLLHKMDSLYEKDRSSYFTAFTIAYGVAFCADTTLNFPFIQFPNQQAKPDNLDLETFISWQSGFGNWQNKVEMNNSKLLVLESLALDCGIHDGWITEGTMFILNQLIEKGIPVDAFLYDGGHTDKLHIRLKKHLFPYFSTKFTFQ